MHKISGLLIAAAILYGCSSTKVNSTKVSLMITSANNTLSEQEKNNGWQLLFDGNTTNGWHTYGKQTVGKAWQISDSALHLDASNKKDWQINDGGDIVTDDEFDNFHLQLDWKVAPGGNSGVIFYINEDSAKYKSTWHTGMEMQVLDNAAHPDAKITKHRAGDLYDLIVSKEVVKPAGEWNHAEIISNNGKLEFYLNGQQTLSTNLWDENWKTLVAGSKFKERADFGTFKKGKIALQDHGDNVWFKNIRIKRL
jgi:hypothetical protein